MTLATDLFNRVNLKFDVKDTLNFTLPRELEASEPPEARGLKRDAVKLMV
jgi:hypothetical protein